MTDDAAFDAWVESFRGEPDVDGQRGHFRVGFVALLRELWDEAGGPVSQERVHAEASARERRYVTAAVPLVEADLISTTDLRPQLRIEILEHEVIAVTFDGNYQTPVTGSVGEAEVICDVADNIRDQVVDELWTVWPVCRAHGGGLDPKPVDGRAVWLCRLGDHIVADIGALRR